MGRDKKIGTERDRTGVSTQHYKTQAIFFGKNNSAARFSSIHTIALTPSENVIVVPEKIS